MDINTFFSSPAAAGALISVFLESLPQMKDPAFANWKKALLAILFGVGYVLVRAVLFSGIPSTMAGWQDLFNTAVIVLGGMQLLHLVVHQMLLPAINKPTATATITTGTTSAGTSITQTVTSEPPVEPTSTPASTPLETPMGG